MFVVQGGALDVSHFIEEKNLLQVYVTITYTLPTYRYLEFHCFISTHGQQ